MKTRRQNVDGLQRKTGVWWVYGKTALHAQRKRSGPGIVTAIVAVALLVGSPFLVRPGLAQGPLNPTGAPGPTFKTLQQIEPRTAITITTAFTISTSGSYYLTTNITVATGNAITITTDGVTLDLNGFTISSTAPAPGSGTAILLSGGRRDVAIHNGHIRGNVVFVGGGGDQFNGPGFLNGISWTTTSPLNVRVTDISVSGCDQSGIQLGDDFTSVVERCTVRTVGAEGIRAGSVNNSTAFECGGAAIVSRTANNCVGDSKASYGVFAATAVNCLGTSVTSDGIFANSAQNCYGLSTGAGGGHGLNVSVAHNCRGSAVGTGHGVLAVSAENCEGLASSGDGIHADNADNCNGYSSFGGGNGVYAEYTASNCRGVSSQSGRGVIANSTQNCYGISTSGTGLRAINVAIGCIGLSVFGTGLDAYIANSCFANSTSIIHKYNMP